MSTIKSSSEHLVLNADGVSKDIKFQANGVEKASISSTGAFTSTSIDATKLSGALPAIDGSALTNLSAGKVLQVVSVTSTATFSTTSGTLQNTGINLAITPTLATSKIMVFVTASTGQTTGGTAAIGIRRGATDIGIGIDVSNRRGVATTGGDTGSDNNSVGSATANYLDSPSTTSATTYSITLSARDTFTAWINRTHSDADGVYTVRPVSTITLMEIGV